MKVKFTILFTVVGLFFGACQSTPNYSDEPVIIPAPRGAVQFCRDNPENPLCQN